MNTVQEIYDKGQSVWLDNIKRGMFLSGELTKLIQSGITGMTSNPTIFQKALASGADYDDDIRSMVKQGKTPEEIFDALAIDDIQKAADGFRETYDKTQKKDGYVSIEVSPQYARDTEKTLSEARRLWKAVDRPNVMIKIPATQEGLPAIETCLSEGININVTLIFSVDRYNEVIDAYKKGLEKRAQNKLSVQVASVASFFVSRIDATTDKKVQEKIEKTQDSKQKDLLLDLLGKSAVANAKNAYQLFKKRFSEPWFTELKNLGAWVQRPLWASTGTKNPHYSDVLYVDKLIGADTVNTMPPATFESYLDHGQTDLTVEADAAEAQQIMDRLQEVKISFKDITDTLEKDGVQQFEASYETLLAELKTKCEAMA